MTRKGLALGSTFALVASAVVGFAAPAQASSLTVIPSSGTSTTTISGEAFSVKVLGQFAATDDLHWEIAGIDTANETVAAVSSGGGAATGTTTQTLDVTAPSIGSGSNALTVAIAAAETGSVTVRAYVESGDAVGFNATFDTSYSAPLTLNFLKAANVTAVTTITAPVEGDTSAEASMYFVGINNEQLAVGDVGVYFTLGTGATLYPTASATAAVADGTTITYTAANNFVAGQTVTITGFNEAGFNLAGATLATVSATNFTVTNALAAATATGTGSVANAAANSVKSGVAWSSTESAFVYTTDAVSPLVKATGIKVQPLYKAAGTVTSTDTIATAAVATVATRAAATITAGSVASTTANTLNKSLLNSSFAVKATVKDAATPTPAAVAGAAVTATVTTNAALSAVVGSVVSLTVNGTVHTSIATLPGASATVAKLALTTDANGEVSVPLTTVGYTAGQTVTVSFTTENLTATVVSTQEAATYTVNHAAFATTTDNASVSVPVSVYDQFGGRPANNYDVRAVFDTTNGAYVAQVIGGVTTASTTATSTNVALVGGNATLVITDNGTGLGVNSYDVSVEKRAAGGAYVADASMPAVAAVLDVHIKSAASLVAATVTTSGVQDAVTKVYAVAGTKDLSLVAAASYDATNVLGAAPVATFTGLLATEVIITGTVSTVASATALATAIPGASVTVSGAGLQFFDGVNKYSAGSITVAADINGVYVVEVFSNLEGKQTLTITSGAASATTTVVFAQAKADTGTALVINAVDNVLPGSTLSVAAVLTDKFGNTVTTDTTAANAAGYLVGATTPTFTLSSTSPGFQIGTDPTATDKNGSAKLAYFLGVNDSGTITVTATYDADGTGTAFAAVTVTKTITIGSAAVSSWTKNLNDGTVKMYAKNIVSAGKVQFMLNGKEIAWVRAASAADSKLRTANGASYLVRTVDLVKGKKNVLLIFVDGVQITRTAYTY